jgi:hypothetical protein
MVLCLLGACACDARAAFITSSTGINPPTVVNFTQFGTTQTFFGGGPREVGGLVGESITFTSSNTSSSTGAFLGTGTYNLDFTSTGGNGRWSSTTGTNARGGFVGLNAQTGDITFKFNAGPVAQVGAFINYRPTVTSVLIEALGADGSVLESYDVTALAPIDTAPTSFNAGAFVGISRTGADIVSFRVRNSFVALDDLTFSRVGGTGGPPNVVPAPSGIVMSLGAALCGVAFRVRRQRSAP